MANSHNGIGSALRTARNARGLSLSDVAADAGISVATLSRIETDKQDIDVTLLRMLSGILHVTPAQFLGGDSGDGRVTAEALIHELAMLPIAERSQVFTAAMKQGRGPRSRETLEVRIENLLSALDLIEQELRALQRDVKRRK